MKIKQFYLLQLLLFIDRLPPNKASDIATLRKLNGASKELRNAIGTYEQGLFKAEDKVRNPDLSKEERQAAQEAVQSFRSKHDSKDVDFAFKNPEHAVTVKRIFKEHFKDYTWLRIDNDYDNPVIVLADFFGIKDEE